MFEKSEEFKRKLLSDLMDFGGGPRNSASIKSKE
jgi:hypothetical protein